MINVYKDDDLNYLHWIEKNPNGFVLNTTRPPLPEFLILHRSSCPAVYGDPEPENYWTIECVKVCADSTGQLSDWARDEVGGRPKACRICSPLGG
ncbi:MAG TPA: hypothetical protein VJ768_09400 [Anaerolineales bacterium]|nr:hypothetical protein [Anaerolineales bacterium]